MKYLFTSMPVVSHVLPLVPLAQQLTLDGHDVLVATTGPAADTARRAGLTTVDAGGRLDAREPYDQLLEVIARGESGHAADDAEALRVHGAYFGEVGLRMLDDLLGIGRQWGAEAVVYPGIHACGLVVAHALGAVGVLHGYGIPLPTFAPALEHMLTSRDDLPDCVPEADVELDVLPPSLPNFAELPWTNGKPRHRLGMRYGSFNGAGDVPPWLLHERDVPRVILTCGTTEAQAQRGDTYRRIVEALEGTECEAVILSGGAVLDRLPVPLPPWVRLERWLPLKFALDQADAIVHHGGSGSLLTSFAAGLPQVVIPIAGTVSMSNGQAVEACGAGTMVDPNGLNSAELAKAAVDVLTSSAKRGAAAAVQREMEEMPSVRTVATRLSSIVGERAEVRS
ncbi:glycosyltransferase [Nocardiopsis sp. L17-MgMaSL7]|uniref:glycosyltransferase n=1 Tax=Nocardiopsis sp. L17-MgMaSL7 TaxID=1938893 RepID=UPI000D711214|nr:nucleotide disphospho-sugar-binding domain-containing protein [Nocardiopsis sp. L17-MgMaSL7]PWV57368.1 glycosyltransferase [Nocardiopsis sp. L17-MgMaSL7]